MSFEVRLRLLRGEQQRQRRELLAVVVDHQRLEAHRAILVEAGVEVSDARGGRADTARWAPGRRRRRGTGRRRGRSRRRSCSSRRTRAAGLSGLPGGGEYETFSNTIGSDHVVGLLHARGEQHVAVQRDRGLVQDLADLADFAGRTVGRMACAAGVCPPMGATPGTSCAAAWAGRPCCRSRASSRRRRGPDPSAARRRTRCCRSPSPWRRRAGR